MARSTVITEAKIDRVLRAMVNNGIAVGQINIMSDCVELITEQDNPESKRKPKIKEWTKSPFDDNVCP